MRKRGICTCHIHVYIIHNVHVLFINRFAYSRGQDDLPLWLRPQLQKYDKFGPAQRELTSFFKTAQNKVINTM